ncbi:tetraspanin-31-B-like isoform X2 [Amphiura filiformis]|uniref:tetraspanin-31-B-like isoform X2 n=1 Tax=Amphiura filiformis TaxID=82378 RepID=UPI003B215110
MVCGGFQCSKNALIALNSLYIIVALILIIVPSVAKTQAYVSSLYIVGGIIACGIFLMFVAIIGLVGAAKHHQVCLFFYMVILFLVFLIQFSVSIACLSLGDNQRQGLIEKSWNSASESTLNDIQRSLHNGNGCCNLYKNVTGYPDIQTVPCEGLPCCEGNATCPKCPQCFDKLDFLWENGLHISGGVGLFFSFTEIIGIWITFRFRNQKDPRANPNAFL